MDRESARNVSVRERSGIRKLSVALLVCEGGLISAAAIYAVLSMLPRSSELMNFALAVAGFLAVFAVLILLAAKSLWNFGRFGVSYSVTWQLFQALVCASLLRGGFIVAGLIGLALAVLLFVLLLRRENRPDREHLVLE